MRARLGSAGACGTRGGRPVGPCGGGSGLSKGITPASSSRTSVVREILPGIRGLLGGQQQMMRGDRDRQAGLYRRGDLQEDLEHRLGKFDAPSVGTGQPRSDVGGLSASLLQRAQEVDDLGGVLSGQVSLVSEWLASGWCLSTTPSSSDHYDQHARFDRLYFEELHDRKHGDLRPEVGKLAGDECARGCRRGYASAWPGVQVRGILDRS